MTVAELIQHLQALQQPEAQVLVYGAVPVGFADVLPTGYEDVGLPLVRKMARWDNGPDQPGRHALWNPDVHTEPPDTPTVAVLLVWQWPPVH